MNALFALLQRLLPQHLLSRLTGRAANARARWIRKPFVHGFARIYGVDLSEAEHPRLDDYDSFNAFFTRALAPGARPLDPDPAALLSPADGMVSQAGRLDHDRLMQAKGTSYRLADLIGAGGGAADGGEEFHGGSFATIYLAPRDYHRVHLPAAGTLTATTAIPGALFSVNARTEAAVANLFCRNERLVCRFETGHGAMLVVLVGALIVASIETVWGGTPSPYRHLEHQRWQRPFGRGAEIGRFLLGSTVIVCCEPGRLELDGSVRPGTRVKMGQRLGRLR
ncbi:MAG: archaetidylserine decarboxylase [Pseudomonadota bacterium]